jgi:hypothetical protein
MTDGDAERRASGLFLRESTPPCRRALSAPSLVEGGGGGGMRLLQTQELSFF